MLIICNIDAYRYGNMVNNNIIGGRGLPAYQWNPARTYERSDVVYDNSSLRMNRIDDSTNQDPQTAANWSLPAPIEYAGELETVGIYRRAINLSANNNKTFVV